MSALAYPTWAQVETGVSRLCLDIQRLSVKTHHDFQPTLVVGLARGGLIPAVRVSHLLNLPFAALSYSSPKGMGDNVESGNTTSLVEVLSYWKHLECKNVIIVDDIVDSGHTMAFVAKMFAKNEWNVVTACLHLRETSVFTPTFAWQTITKDDPWIVYPWEL